VARVRQGPPFRLRPVSRKRTLWNVPRILGSLRLDAGGLDHLGPLLGLIGDKLSEVGGRSSQDGAAQIGEPRLDLGIGERDFLEANGTWRDRRGRIDWARLFLCPGGMREFYDDTA
jgi:hypothetical protein